MSRGEASEQWLATSDSTEVLRRFTTARIALGRAGGSLRTRSWLDFKASHAAARDAVHVALDVDVLCTSITELGWETTCCSSAAEGRADYLLRPDRGRRLDAESRASLAEVASRVGPCDVVVIVSDGLAASAVHHSAVSVLANLLPRLSSEGWRMAPVCVARHGRVALQDEIGELFQAQLALTLLGERPGLTAANSLGAYLVYDPQRGNTDANRNCVSNIREGGLSCEDAVGVLYQLLAEAHQRKLTGVGLKAIDPTLPRREKGDRPQPM